MNGFLAFFLIVAAALVSATVFGPVTAIWCAVSLVILGLALCLIGLASSLSWPW